MKEAASSVEPLAALLPRASPPASRSAVGAGGGGLPRSVALQRVQELVSWLLAGKFGAVCPLPFRQGRN